MNEEILALQRQLAELTTAMAAKDGSELKELNDKVSLLSKEVSQRKQQFAAGTAALQTGALTKKEADAKMDELFIAQAVLRKKDGGLDTDAYAELKGSADYRDAVKDITTSMVTGADGTLTNFGSDLVVEGFSSTLLEEIWLALEVADLFGRFNMPSATYTFPFAQEKLIARRGLEGRAVTKDKFATGSLQFIAKKLLSVVDFTDEMEADAIIPMLPLIRQKLIEGFAQAQEMIAINGDTDDTTGINGDISADAEDARNLAKGIRAHGIADGAKTDFGGTGVTSDLMRDMRASMGKYGKNPSDLAYIISMDDYNKILKSFTNYQTFSSYAANSVIARGELGRIDNIPLIISELLPTDLAATGIYTGTGATSTIALVNKKALMWGDRAAFGLEMYRSPLTQSESLIGSQRLDLQKVTSATSTPIAVGINV